MVVTGFFVLCNWLSTSPDADLQHTISNCKSMWLSHYSFNIALKVLVTTIDAQWEGMGDVGWQRYEPALLPPCPTIRVLSYSN